MKKSIYGILSVIGLVLAGISATGIYNSHLDSRVLFTIAMLSAGMVFLTWGVQALFGDKRRRN